MSSAIDLKNFEMAVNGRSEDPSKSMNVPGIQTSPGFGKQFGWDADSDDDEDDNLTDRKNQRLSKKKQLSIEIILVFHVPVGGNSDR
ncbi:hypothetical protein AYI68_g7205 [Smittium mucronatum]|uniref:Uncharacterized protein n=1 Tax=Smittium mucronatum TaxID=133383 RepID=A0A1R0GPC3_9FUNG|nr:hypothetical protein AYI68_g7205 [Smittium mucronatum]